MKSFKKALFCNSYVFCMVFLFSILYSGKGFANVYVTTTFTDPVFTAVNNATGAITAGAGIGLISLRSALKAADNLGGTHTITLSTGTYLLDGSTSYTIPSLGTFSARTIYFGNTTQNITINGNGPANTIIDMAVAGRDRIMSINYDGVVGDVVTTINGVKFQNGYLTTDEFGGAALYAGPVGGLLQTLTVNNCTFDNNICPGSAGNGGVGGAIYMFQETLTVDNCTFTNNQSVDGVAGAIFFILYNNQGNDGNVNITNSTFSGNSAKSLGGAIHIASQGAQPGGTTFTTTINNNTFLNNFTTLGAGGAVALNNGANLSVMQVHYNRFVGNVSFSSALSSGLHFVESDGSVNAENNWWGCNTNPVSAGSTAPCNQAGGDVPGLGSLDASPWIQLKTTASPSTICNTPAGLGNTTTVTTSFLNNSDGGVLTLANISRLIGLPVTWTSTLGSLSAQQLTIQASGTATATFTSNGTGGTATVNTQVDNVPSTEASPARANITVNTIPVVTDPSNFTSCVGGTATFSSTITGTPAPSIQWYLGATPLVNGLQGSGSTISGATTNTLTITNVQAGDAAVNYNVRASNQCGEDISANTTLFVNQVTGGAVDADQTICEGADPNAFTETAASTGSGTLTYQWQKSNTSCIAGFSDIINETGTTYDPPAQILTTYYRRVTTSTLNGVPCTANSNCITVLINSVTSGAIGSDQTLCSPADPAELTEINASTGSGTLTYQWQSSTTDCNNGYSDIMGETGITYDPPSGLTVTTYYQRVTTSTLGPVLCTATSNCVIVTVNPDNTITLTSGAGTDAQTVFVNTPITTITYATTGATGATFSGLPPGVNGSWAADVVTINGSPSATGVYNYTVTLTGGCGVITANGSITVNLPCTPPSFSVCPNNIIVNTDPLSCAATVSYTATATGDPVPTLSYVFSGATSGGGAGTGTGSGFNKGVTTVTITATNGCGADAICSFTITVNDTEKPVITCPSDITDNAITGTCGKVIFYNVTATDNCPGVGTSMVSGYGSGQIFPVGTSTEIWMATDASGNTATCSFTVTIIDNQNPIITGCPSPIVKNTDAGICTTTATWVAPTASDNCPGVVFTSNYAPGATFPKGVTNVVYTATDASGNTSVCTFTVTVNDVELPVISNCPNNTTVNATTDLCSAAVTWTAPTATDNCMISSFTGTHSSGSSFPVGTTPVTYTATDMSGNTKTCSFTVTVTDNQLPKITCPGNAMRGTAEGTCKYTINAAEFDATATDNCNIAPPLTYSYTGPTSGSGNTSLNGIMFNKGLYTITWKATDVNGNTSTCSFTVDVKDNELPKITCPADKTVVTSPGLCTATVALGSATVSDNCGVLSTTNNGVNPFPVGMTIVTWTVTDVNGNTKTCTQKVTVVPYSCGAPTQVLHTDTTATTAKIKWKVGKCATSYQVRLRQELTPGVWGAWSAWMTFSGPAGPPQWTHQFTGLNPNKFHNSQVRSVCGSSFSAAINDWWWTLPSFAPIEDRIANQENEIPELPAKLSFIPNPAREFTTIIIEGFEQSEKTVTMFDLYGKLVFSTKVEADQNQLELELETLNVHTGIYLIQVSDKYKRKTEQLMIER